MGSAKFMLRQIINFCGRISKDMLQSATNLDNLKDKELHGIPLLIWQDSLTSGAWSGAFHGKPYSQFGSRYISKPHRGFRKRNIYPSGFLAIISSD